MSVLRFNKDSFNSAVASGKTVLVDFYADWCGPCRMVAPNVEAVAAARPDAIVGKVNVDDEVELARKFGVYSIPTLVVLRNGSEIGRAVGVKSTDAILQMLGAD